MNRMWIAPLLLLLVGIGAPSARADNFEFTNTIGTVADTVTGEILGLTNGAPGPASDVIITSYPTLFYSEPGLGTPPLTPPAFRNPPTARRPNWTKSSKRSHRSLRKAATERQSVTPKAPNQAQQRAGLQRPRSAMTDVSRKCRLYG